MMGEYVLAEVSGVGARAPKRARQEGFQCQVCHWNGVQCVRCPCHERNTVYAGVTYLAYDALRILYRLHRASCRCVADAVGVFSTHFFALVILFFHFFVCILSVEVNIYLS